MITSAHSNSSNSVGLNLIFQKFYKMIYEMIVSEKLCGIFLIFCGSIFINNYMVKNSFLKPKNQRMLNISRPIYFKKISVHRFVRLTCTNKLKGFFSRTWSFFHDSNMTNLGVNFIHKKIILCFFSMAII